ncbi:hypothetical protein D3C81_731660 [compost metagenome]
MPPALPGWRTAYAPALVLSKALPCVSMFMAPPDCSRPPSLSRIPVCKLTVPVPAKVPCVLLKTWPCVSSVTFVPAMVPCAFHRPPLRRMISPPACRVPPLLTVAPVVITCNWPCTEASLPPALLSTLAAFTVILPVAASKPPALLNACATFAVSCPPAVALPPWFSRFPAPSTTLPPPAMAPPWLLSSTLFAITVRLEVPAACTLPPWL